MHFELNFQTDLHFWIFPHEDVDYGHLWREELSLMEMWTMDIYEERSWISWRREPWTSVKRGVEPHGDLDQGFLWGEELKLVCSSMTYFLTISVTVTCKHLKERGYLLLHFVVIYCHMNLKIRQVLSDTFFIYWNNLQRKTHGI